MAKEVETALEKYPTVAISSLEIKDVENALNLHLDRRDKELEQVTPITPPPPPTTPRYGIIKIKVSQS